MVPSAGSGSNSRAEDTDEWIIEIEKERDQAPVDAVWLTCEDGGYCEMAKREAAEDRGSYWFFLFPTGPRGRYRVEVVSRGQRYPVWKGLQLPQQEEASTPLEDGPRPATIVVAMDCG
jgi:hypothetical protein